MDDDDFFDDVLDEPCECLDLSNQSLDSVPVDQVQAVDGLGSLDLSGNALTSLADVELPESVTSLDLRDNRLTSLGEGTFRGLAHLQTLKLDHNQLTHLPDSLLRLSSLSTLTLEHNAFSVDSLRGRKATSLVAPFGFSFVLDMKKGSQGDEEATSSSGSVESQSTIMTHYMQAEDDDDTNTTNTNTTDDNGVDDDDDDDDVPAVGLAGCSKPQFAHEIVALRALNVGLLVTALAKPDLSAEVTEQLEALDMRRLHVHTINGCVPSFSDVDAFVAETHACLSQGTSVTVHCMAGKGRTGTLLACYLVAKRNMDWAKAVAYIRSKRPGSIETETQEDFVYRYALHVHGTATDDSTAGGGVG